VLDTDGQWSASRLHYPTTTFKEEFRGALRILTTIHKCGVKPPHQIAMERIHAMKKKLEDLEAVLDNEANRATIIMDSLRSLHSTEDFTDEEKNLLLRAAFQINDGARTLTEVIKKLGQRRYSS
jgi:hypothetical protein